jgi:hypothetical protein
MDTGTEYWGVVCRTCGERIAFDACPYNKPALGFASVKAGAVCCIHGHIHIYFPRDFHFFSSATPIMDATLQENRTAYEAINPAV